MTDAATFKTIIPYVRQGCYGYAGQRCLGSDNVSDLWDKCR